MGIKKSKKLIQKNLINELSGNELKTGNSNSFETMNHEGCSEYLIECFRLAHYESMDRIKNRDSWLKYQLFCQVSLFAIFQGVELGGIKPATALPDILILCPIVSLIFYILYTIENSLIGYLSRYIASLSHIEQRINGGELIKNWDASHEYRQRYTKSTLYIRTISQTLTFFVLPLSLFAFRAIAYKTPLNIPSILEIIINSIILIIIAVLILINHKHRSIVIFNIEPK